MKKCLGFWEKDVVHINERSQKSESYFVTKRQVFPCVPVSEHEAYKEKVKKVVNELEELVGEIAENKDAYLNKELNWADTDAFFEKMDWLVEEFKEAKKELGLKQNEKAVGLK